MTPLSFFAERNSRAMLGVESVELAPRIFDESPQQPRSAIELTVVDDDLENAVIFMSDRHASNERRNNHTIPSRSNDLENRPFPKRDIERLRFGIEKYVKLPDSPSSRLTQVNGVLA